MIDQDEFLLRIVNRLAEVGIPYMIAGSYASNIHVDYLHRWAAELGVQSELAQLLELAEQARGDNGIQE